MCVLRFYLVVPNFGIFTSLFCSFYLKKLLDYIFKFYFISRLASGILQYI